MRKPSTELKTLFTTYLNKRLRPENALEFASSFTLDLINCFGDRLDDETPLKAEWQEYTPFTFILQLNSLLTKFKNGGHKSLDDVEKTLLADTHVMLGALIGASLAPRSGTAVSEERFQIPNSVAEDLDYLLQH